MAGVMQACSVLLLLPQQQVHQIQKAACRQRRGEKERRTAALPSQHFHTTWKGKKREGMVTFYAGMSANLKMNLNVFRETSLR